MDVWDRNAVDSPGSYRWNLSISKSWCRVQHRTSWGFLDLLAYRFHSWTPCWLIPPVSSPGLWKLRNPSQEAVNKKFHVFSAKPFISSVAHISVGGRTSWWPREASTNTQALAHWFQITSLYPLSNHFYFKSLFTLIRPFHLNLQDDDLYGSKML